MRHQPRILHQTQIGNQRPEHLSPRPEGLHLQLRHRRHRRRCPAEYINIGYFEAYNVERPCLDMRITGIDLTPYTHINLSFGEAESNEVDTNPIQDRWELFRQLSGLKKILSLGGWSFSIESATDFIFRKAVQPGNQDTFVDNIVYFVTEDGLDGIDTDRECKVGCTRSVFYARVVPSDRTEVPSNFRLT
ncbi:hypothetical protein N7491_001673 [Penicillium cf. griseofulvum]|uniref:GH18 domain-containing protein n=1 Tax=Penicillium cf. griseofulvum TaxID=2972120 RepID=A0A9W9M930_9EURO|nr:hypothetical protein N7472_006802 [Penicillium cf. griseofulvum]KAJ5445591.1 hypothetical protein N7491_001673 [Penicillium cf. griseofulvum]